MNYAVFEQCHCTPDRLPFLTGFRVGMPSLARTSCTHGNTLRSPAARCIANDQFDTPVRAVRRRDLAALIKMLDQLHEAARCDRALTNACEAGFLEGVKLLYSRASSSWQSGHAFMLAAKNGHTRVALFLFRTKLPDVLCHCECGASIASSWGHIETAKALIRGALSEWPDDQSVLSNFISVAAIVGDARLVRTLLDKTPSLDATCAMRLPLLYGHWECASLMWNYLTENGRQDAQRKYGQETAQMIAWRERSALLQSTVDVSINKPSRRL
ncbi:TPA: ankyrin repeat domain-containing protein [Stenotrophomonas maltophilia]|uniref:ankyrin repeat domain-containing protein n=1 Tax=Stenotrophomonas maltophilia TaxID=40324 RepID=UPI0013130A5A|nr:MULTISPECIES: ankyrin repeat domain-containing protein [Stenotrophomonas]MCO7496880.1 ankyrin repeat domain-containing protein [Stenotrophomonas maltophilia]